MKKTKKIQGILVSAALFVSTLMFSQPLPPQGQAGLNASDTIGCLPLTVNFSPTTVGTSYFWDLGNGQTSTLSNPSALYNSPGTYTVQLTTTLSTGITENSSQEIVVNDKPQVNMFAPDSTFCGAGQSFTPEFSSSVPIQTVFWDFGDGHSSNQPNPSHVYNQQGSYTVYLMVTDSNGCSDFVNQPSFVRVFPTVDANFVSNNTQSCFDSTVFNFTNNSTGSGTLSCLWNLGDGYTSSQLNPSHQYFGTGSFDIQLWVTDINGCADSMVRSNYILIGDTTPVNISSSSTQACTFNNIIFSLTSSANIASGVWNFGDGAIGTGISSTHAYNTPGNFNITGAFTDSMSCVHNGYTSASVLISNPVPPVIGSNILAGCPPLTVTLHDSSLQSWNSYLWTAANGVSSASPMPTITFNDPGIYEVQLITTSGNGCSVQATPISVTVYEKSPMIYHGPLTGCAPFQINFGDSSALTTNWSWALGNGATSAQQNPSTTYSNQGSYGINVITENIYGCVDTTFLADSVQIILPDTGFSPAQQIYSCYPFQVNFYYPQYSGGSMFWDFGDGDTSNLSYPSHYFQNAGQYEVSLRGISDNGCPFEKDPVAVVSIDSMPKDYIIEQYCDSIHIEDNSSNVQNWLWHISDNTYHTYNTINHNFIYRGTYSLNRKITTFNQCVYNEYFPGIFVVDTCLADSLIGGNSGPDTTSTSAGAGNAVPPLPVLPIDSMNVNFNSNSNPFGCAPLSVNFIRPETFAVSCNWNFGDGGFSSQLDPVHVYTDTGVFDVQVIWTDSTGTTYTYNYNDYVFVSSFKPSFTWNSRNMCQGGQVEFNSTQSNLYYYNWNFGNGSSAQGVNTLATYPQTGQYVVSLNAQGPNGCVGSASAVIQTGQVSPQFSYPRELCNGDTLQVSHNIDRYLKYHWYANNVLIDTNQTPSVAMTNNGLFNIKLIVTDDSLCMDTFSLADPVRVTGPIAMFSINQNLTGCSPFQVQVLNASNDGGSWQWLLNNVPSSQQFEPSLSLVQQGDYLITLIATDSAGCSNAFVLPDTLHVYPTPSASFTITQNKDCFPMAVSFQNTSTGQFNSTSWVFGNGVTSSLQNPGVTYSTQPASDPTVTVSNIYGCSDSENKPLTIFSPDFNINSAYGCVPKEVTFSESTGTAQSCFWNFGDGNSASGISVMNSYADTGIFSVEIVATSMFGCVDSVEVLDLVHVVQVIADFTSSYSAPVCAPVPVLFTDQSLNAINYNWNFGDGSSISIPNPSHVFTLPSDYYVELIADDGFGCYDTTMNGPFEIVGPIASFTVDNYQSCDSLPVNFTNLTSGGLDFQWFFGNGATSTGLNESYTYYQTGAYTASLLASDSMGCTSIFSVDSLMVFEIPTYQLSVPDTQGCSPFNFTLINTNHNLISEWEIAGVMGQTPDINLNLTTQGISNLSYYLTSSDGCKDTFNLNNIEVFSTPNTSFEVDNSRGCWPITLDFSNSSTCDDPVQHFWDFGDGFNSTDINPVHEYTTAGIYSVALYSHTQEGCSDSLILTNHLDLTDSIDPGSANIHFASWENNQKLYVSWQENQALDFEYYIIWQRKPGGLEFVSIDTLYNHQDTLVSLVYDNDEQNSACYKIQAVDKCGNRKSLESIMSNCPVNLSVNKESYYKQLDWSPYFGRNPEAYQVMRKNESSAQYEIIAETNKTQYVDSTYLCSGNNVYLIKAVSLDGSAYSALSNTDLVHVSKSEFRERHTPIILRSSVEENEFILTEWKTDEKAAVNITEMNMFRKSDREENFTMLEVLDSYQEAYLDYSVDVNNLSYEYQIQTVSSCDISPFDSHKGQSIMLRSESEGLGNRLFWNPYDEWESGVKYYILQRKTQDGEWEFVKKIPGNRNNTYDELDKFLYGE